MNLSHAGISSKNETASSGSLQRNHLIPSTSYPWDS